MYIERERKNIHNDKYHNNALIQIWVANTKKPSTTYVAQSRRV